jgi:multidrug efflux pump
LSIAIAGGLMFATVLTLVLTPCMLVMGEAWENWQRERRERRERLVTA